MRRIQLVLAALAIVVTALAAFSGPAMADDLNCLDAWGNLIWCEGGFYTPVDDWWGYEWRDQPVVRRLLGSRASPSGGRASEERGRAGM